MKIITCPKCSSKFDASTFEPGSKFECVSCKNVIIIPGEDTIQTLKPVAQGRPQPQPKPARPAARGKPAPAARRPAKPAARPAKPAGRPAKPATRRQAAAAPAGRGRSAAPARGTGRPVREERGGRGRARPEAAARSNTAIFVVLGALGLAALAIIVVIMAGGDDPKEPIVPVVDNDPVVDPAPEPDANDPKTWSMSRKHEHWTNLKLSAIGIPADQAIPKLRANYEWAEKYGLPAWKKEAVDAAIKLDPQDDWANEQRGWKRFRYDFYELDPDSEAIAIPFRQRDEILEIVEAGEGDSVWLSPEEYARIDSLQAEEKKHYDRISSDRQYFWMQKTVLRAPLYAEYQSYDFEVSEQFPYVIFVTKKKGGSARENAEAKKIVERDARIFQTLLSTFTDTFEPEIRKLPGRSDFKMPRFEETAWGEIPIMKVWVFFSFEDFQKYQISIGHRLPAGVRAYYKPGNQWITLYEGRADRGENQKLGKQDFNTGKTFHEGLHQLVHLYTRLLLSEKTNTKVEFEDPRLRCKSHWFQEGLAEFIGAADENGDSWDCLAIHHRRLREFRGTQNAHKKNEKFPVWSLTELLQVGANPDISRWCQRKARAAGNMRYAGMLSSLFYAHSWLFCHFLWNYEDGKYRGKFMEYMALELEGQSGFEVWKKVMKDVCPGGDFTKLEKELFEYEATLKGL